MKVAPEGTPRAWVVPALPLLVFSLAGTRAGVLNPVVGERVPDLVAWGLVSMACLALALRAWEVRVGLVVCAVATVAYLVAAYPTGPVLLAGPLALYLVARTVRFRETVTWAVAFLVSTVVPPLVVAAADPEGAELLDGRVWWALRWTTLLVAALITGSALQARDRAAVAARSDRARAAASSERLAMAADVHDGVGHALALVALHAGVAQRIVHSDPDRAAQLLGEIRTTSRTALEELRGDLARLRSGDAAGARRPRPGLAEIGPLLERMSAGGLRVEADIPADGRSMPSPVEAAVFRVVQESLTNVLRHAGTDIAWVRVVVGPDEEESEVMVEIVDHGRGPTPSAGPGHGVAGSGIDGMRHRVDALGGTLQAGAGESGGFRVRAVLPIPPEEVNS